MGSGKPSKHAGMVNKAPTGTPMVAAAAFPPQPPYAGPPVINKHVIINATMDVNAKLSFLQPNISVTSTNMDTYYPVLASLYGQGFRMLVFVVLPGSTHSFGLSQIGQSQSTMKFQGIFRQQFPDEAGQQWELRVEKSMIVNQMFYQWQGIITVRSGMETHSMSSNHHIIQTINNVTQNGGRLISVEMTGMGGQQLEMQRSMMQHGHRHLRSGEVAPAIQVPVDVFYEIPLHPTSERYVYQIVPCPMVSVFQQKFPMGRFNSTINWQAVMQEYMGVGWKLVEIFEDSSASTQTSVQGFTANVNVQKNCLWIFEKPISRLNDNTPYYEGTMMEHWFRTQTQVHGLGLGGASVNVTTDWEPAIEHMGNYGWQVVRILSTPDTILQGSFSTNMTTRQMIFFQRRLRDDAGQGLTTSPPVSKMAPVEDGPPRLPGYDELYPDPVQKK